MCSGRGTRSSRRSPDLGRAAVFLASDEAVYIAGTVLTVDGGAFIQGPAWAGGESQEEGCGFLQLKLIPQGLPFDAIPQI